jgi:hypothetical protein
LSCAFEKYKFYSFCTISKLVLCHQARYQAKDRWQGDREPVWGLHPDPPAKQCSVFLNTNQICKMLRHQDGQLLRNVIAVPSVSRDGHVSAEVLPGSDLKGFKNKQDSSCS